MKKLERINNIAKLTKLSSAILLTMVSMANTANATVSMVTMTNDDKSDIPLLSDSDWQTSISGSIPVFLVSSNQDDGESGVRIQSGFNPANLNFRVVAPKTESGLSISGNFQIDTHLQGSGVQNSSIFESRVANIQISSNYGTITAGKDFGVFNSSAIGDKASQGGVGWLLGGADTGSTTGGRIGTGYVYANFNPQLKYTSNDLNGFKFKAALINPEEPQDAAIETNSPRIEAQVNYSANLDIVGFQLWAGFLQQNVSVLGATPFDYDMKGFDVGTHISVGDFSFMMSFTDTTGIGADGLYGGTINDANVDATQWYVEAYYTFDKATVGYSYGEGQQDSREANASNGLVAVAEVDNELSMLFAHYQLTPEFRLVAELQDYQSDVQANYDAIVLGFQYDF